MRIVWISNFPVEWLPDAPEAVRALPRGHPATWRRVLLDEMRSAGDLNDAPDRVQLHVIDVRNQFERDFSFAADGAMFHCLRVPPAMRTLSLFWWETLRIRRLLRMIKPDLVHAWGTERGAALVASRLRVPSLITMQGLLEWYSEHVKLSRFQRLEARLEPVSLRRARIATAESSFAVRWLRDRYPNLEIRQIEHAPNWLFHRVQRRPEPGPMRFLYVGALAPLKGTDLLLRSLDRLSGELDFQITLVGSGAPEFLDELRSATSPALWQRVQTRHNLEQAQVAEEMARATMVLFPTRVDTSPNSVKEAVAAGVPVVASAIGGIPDYVIPGKNGILFSAGNLDEFVRAVKEAAAHPLFGQGKVDPDTRARMCDYLSPRRMREGFLAAYRRVLEL